MKKVKKISKTLVTVTILTVLFTVLLSLGLFYKLFFEGYEERESVKIPNYIGRAADDIERDGFDVEIYPIYTDRESGIVLSQEPPEDSLRKIARGEKIKLRLGVSAPEKRVILPDFYGFDSREAEIMLRRLGLEPIEVKIKVDFAESGSVVSTSPLARTRLCSGDKVTVYVAENRLEHSSAVPNFVGLSLEDAERMIEESGFVLGEVFFEETDEGLFGMISKQSLPFGIFAMRGSVIDLTVRVG